MYRSIEFLVLRRACLMLTVCSDFFCLSDFFVCPFDPPPSGKSAVSA